MWHGSFSNGSDVPAHGAWLLGSYFRDLGGLGRACTHGVLGLGRVEEAQHLDSWLPSHMRPDEDGVRAFD